MEQSEALKEVVAFHGHICPGIAYGYRVAETALNALGERARDEEIVAVVENDSCAVDAIQVMTGCTFGKGNLIFKDYGKQVYTFFSRDTGKGLRISVDYNREETPEERDVWQRYGAGDRTAEVVKALEGIKRRKIEEILKSPSEKLFSLNPVTVPPPPKARIVASLHCAQCGEKMMETRTREIGGKGYCIPCGEGESG
ncbi:MAG: FmdE family protein [bacterium]|nr:FmdE family protein [bacterium]